MTHLRLTRTAAIAIISALLAIVALLGYSIGSAETLDASPARTTTISVPSGARIAIYPVAGHTSAEVRWKCAGGRYRIAADYIQPGCNRVTLTARIWFDYAVIWSQQQDA